MKQGTTQATSTDIGTNSCSTAAFLRVCAHYTLPFSRYTHQAASQLQVVTLHTSTGSCAMQPCQAHPFLSISQRQTAPTRNNAPGNHAASALLLHVQATALSVLVSCRLSRLQCCHAASARVHADILILASTLTLGVHLAPAAHLRVIQHDDAAHEAEHVVQAGHVLQVLTLLQDRQHNSTESMVSGSSVAQLLRWQGCMHITSTGWRQDGQGEGRVQEQLLPQCQLSRIAWASQ